MPIQFIEVTEVSRELELDKKRTSMTTASGFYCCIIGSRQTSDFFEYDFDGMSAAAAFRRAGERGIDVARLRTAAALAIADLRITQVVAAAFARLMTDKLENGDANARKGYIRSIINAIEVDDKAVRSMAARISCKPSLPANRPRTETFVVLYANGAP
jgi:hypothetical protein